MSLDEHLQALTAEWPGDFDARLKALAAFAEAGPSGLGRLSEVVQDTVRSVTARIWATQAIAHIGKDDKKHTARTALTILLSESDPSLRRAALNALGNLKDESVIPLIVGYLNDNTEDESAWFEDDCTVGHAAAKALETIGTTTAKTALSTVKRERAT